MIRTGLRKQQVIDQICRLGNAFWNEPPLSFSRVGHADFSEGVRFSVKNASAKVALHPLSGWFLRRIVAVTGRTARVEFT